MNFFKKLLRKDSPPTDWEKVRCSDEVYPKHSFTLLKLTMPNSQPGTGWVDKAYKTYDFKEFCPYHLRISVDLTDKIAKDNPDLDMGTIEDFFSDELKGVCICHLVSRFASDIGMDIECYIEKKEHIEQFLMMASLAKNRLVSFTYKIDFDPAWMKINKLLNA